MSKFTILELVPYIDGNGLMAPCYANPRAQASDNGVMFSSEAMLIDPSTSKLFLEPIKACIVKGRLHRTPTDPAPDAPDDYYGVLALRNRELTGMMWKVPHQFLIQPQVLCMAIEGTIFAPINPLRPLIALIIAVSGYFASGPTKEESHADDWRLAWLLVQAMKGSFLCRLASKLWYKQMHAKVVSMRQVAKTYYRDDHPFTKVSWEQGE